MDFTSFIRTVPDYPKPGIQFRDITTLLKDPTGFAAAIDALVARYRTTPISKIVAIESRGFLFGAPLAVALGLGFVPARKPGKLPGAVVRAEYDLEYGTDVLEIHRDAIRPGQRVLVHDDLLATGGTAAAKCALVEELGGVVAGLAFVVELTFLPGRARLGTYDVMSLVQYASEDVSSE